MEDSPCMLIQKWLIASILKEIGAFLSSEIHLRALRAPMETDNPRPKSIGGSTRKKKTLFSLCSVTKNCQSLIGMWSRPMVASQISYIENSKERNDIIERCAMKTS